MYLLPVYKPPGLTSTSIVEHYKKKLDEPRILHTGALDPLADGLLVLTVGTDDYSLVQEYIGWDKAYQFTALLGFRTDTWDILGLVESVSRPALVSFETLQKLLRTYQGEITQTVPLFSNLYFKNKKLYQWAREGKGHMVTLPKRKRSIYAITIKAVESITIDTLQTVIKQKTQQVHGDFRQEAIGQQWQQTLKPLVDIFNSSAEYTLCTATLECEKGTYVRSLIKDVGDRLGVGSTTWSITRTRVGPYDLQSLPVEVESK